MPLTLLGRASLVTIAVLALAGPAGAEAGPGDGLQRRHDRRSMTRMLPPEARYRDPRYAPPRRVRRFATPPSDLIHAYLPRLTEKPMYNEPPSRFPQR